MLQQYGNHEIMCSVVDQSMILPCIIRHNSDSGLCMQVLQQHHMKTSLILVTLITLFCSNDIHSSSFIFCSLLYWSSYREAFLLSAMLEFLVAPLQLHLPCPLYLHSYKALPTKVNEN